LTAALIAEEQNVGDNARMVKQARRRVPPGNRARHLVGSSRRPTQYRLVPVPAAGKFTCQVTQTNNGKRLDRGGIFPTEEDALRGGLEDLRVALGW
jgi:hypothetical protein